jgi:D-arabinose 1-dehydrogenase-like Zn-dependent alcohol dehydrogenase
MKVVYETRALDAVNEAIEDVEKARVSARLVFDRF